MATDTLKATIPELQPTQKMQLVWEAINPTTGAAVSGVKVSSIGIYGVNLGGKPAGDQGFAPVLLRTAAPSG